jgi:hypothetical protein
MYSTTRPFLFYHAALSTPLLLTHLVRLQILLVSTSLLRLCVCVFVCLLQSLLLLLLSHVILQLFVHNLACSLKHYYSTLLVRNPDQYCHQYS